MAPQIPEGKNWAWLGLAEGAEGHKGLGNPAWAQGPCQDKAQLVCSCQAA